MALSQQQTPPCSWQDGAVTGRVLGQAG